MSTRAWLLLMAAGGAQGGKVEGISCSMCDGKLYSAVEVKNQ